MNIQNPQQKTLFSGNGAFKPVAVPPQMPAPRFPAPVPKFPLTFPVPFPMPFRDDTINFPTSPIKPLVAPAPSPAPVESKAAPRKTKPKSRTGKWTSEEHRKFLEAMEAYGNSWDLVKEHIGTRTAAQIRSHAQKYYCGMRKREIKKLKSDPEKNGAVFVVTKEYLNTCSMGYRRGVSVAAALKKEPVTDPASSQQHTSEGTGPASAKLNETQGNQPPVN